MSVGWSAFISGALLVSAIDDATDGHYVLAGAELIVSAICGWAWWMS